MPDRYADAVRARRVELRAERALLNGGHRRELHTVLALSRMSATAATAAALAELDREIRGCVESADRSIRRRIPALLDEALATQARELHDAWAQALGPPLLRIATGRRLAMGPSWPRLPAPRPLPEQAPPAAVGVARVLFAGVAQGAAVGRLLLIPLAVLPLWGLPALGGRELAPLAVGVAVAAVVGAAWARYVAAERAVLRRHCDGVLATVAAALDTDLRSRLLDLERSAGAALDTAVARRRAEVDAELVALAPAAVSSGG